MYEHVGMHASHERAHSEWRPRDRHTIEWGEAIGAVLRCEGGLSTIGVAALMVLIPLVGQIALIGWASEIAQRVWWGHPQTVPALRFADFGYWLGRGVTPFVTNAAAGMLVGFAMNLLIVPVALVAMAVYAGTGGNGPVAAFAMIGLVCMFGIIVGLIAIPIHATFMTFAEMTEDFSETFRFDRVLDFARATWKLQVLAAAILSIGGGIAAFGGLVLFLIGIFLVIPVIAAVQAHVRAQIVQIYATRGGAPFGIRPPAPVPWETEQMSRSYRHG